MAFTQVRKTHGRVAGERVVTVTKTKKSNQLLVRMSKDVFDALGSPDRVEVFVGTDEDAGSILIAPSGDGSNSYSIWSTARTPNQYSCAVSAKRLGVDAPATASEAAWEITEDGLIVRLPEVPAPTASSQRRVVSRFQSAA